MKRLIFICLVSSIMLAVSAQRCVECLDFGWEFSREIVDGKYVNSK